MGRGGGGSLAMLYCVGWKRASCKLQSLSKQFYCWAIVELPQWELTQWNYAACSLPSSNQPANCNTIIPGPTMHQTAVASDLPWCHSSCREVWYPWYIGVFSQPPKCLFLFLLALLYYSSTAERELSTSVTLWSSSTLVGLQYGLDLSISLCCLCHSDDQLGRAISIHYKGFSSELWLQTFCRHCLSHL